MWEVPGLWPSPAHNPWSPEGQPGTSTFKQGQALGVGHPGKAPAVQVFVQVFTVAHKGQDDGSAAVSKEEGQPVPPSTEGDGEGVRGQHPGTRSASCGQLTCQTSHGNSAPCLILTMEYLD